MKILLTLALLLCIGMARAQNPFEKFGYTPKIGTLSKGKYIEHFDTDSIVQIGSVLFNPYTKKITGFVVQETVYSEATLQPEIVSRWLSPDPLSEEFPSWSPYNFVYNNPIIYFDPDGRAAFSPIYGIDGTFLGTDDQGLQGKAIVMDAENFTQGMSHDDALNNSKGVEGLASTEAGSKLLNHYIGLKDRPDYDGFVTVSEGVDWAKANPGAIDNPTPDNMLYLDASKLDFGNISISDFANGIGKSSPINLLNTGNLMSSIGNETLRATVYALGRVDMNLHNNTGNVSIVNDFNQPSRRATDYDWNTGGEPLRNTLIRAERARTGLNDSHGFRAYYYGTGTLNKPSKFINPQFPVGYKL